VENQVFPRRFKKVSMEGKSPASSFEAACSFPAAKNPHPELATLSRACGNKNSRTVFRPLGGKHF
jgi:hypothetical protein